MLTLLVIYCVLIVTASLIGGWLPNLVKLNHRHTQMVLSLVSGVMLGVAFFHLIPHSIELLDNKKTAMVTTLVGLLFMFFLIRMFHFHYHDPAHEQHDCEHEDHEHDIKRDDISWIGLAIGFAVHTIIDGVALAAAVGAGYEESNTTQLAGLGVFLAILLHKPLDALTITSFMAVRNWPKQTRQTVNFLFALMIPLGVGLFFLSVGIFESEKNILFGITLAFSAGVFLCISLSDLLPEVQFHSHDRLAMSGMLILGVVAAIAIDLLPL